MTQLMLVALPMREGAFSDRAPAVPDLFQAAQPGTASYPLTKDMSCFLPERPFVLKLHCWTSPRLVFLPNSHVLCSFLRGFDATTSLS